MNSVKKVLDFFPPRTPKDFETMAFFTKFQSNEFIFEWMSTEWRSPVDSIDGEDYCAECWQGIKLHICSVCGQHLSKMRSLP